MSKHTFLVEPLFYIAMIMFRYTTFLSHVSNTLHVFTINQRQQLLL